VRLGTPPASSGTSTDYLDSPVAVWIDPRDSNHLVATQGVRGDSIGFFDSVDGGATFQIPPGFDAFVSSVGMPLRDVTSFDVAPENPDRIILSCHADWASGSPGVALSDDCGATWAPVAAQPTWPFGSCGTAILHHPPTGQGDQDTWLWGTDGDGIWRKSNTDVWTKVEARNTAHGGFHHSYSADGKLYIGSQDGPMVSTNNGLSFALCPDVPGYYYYGAFNSPSYVWAAPSYAAASSLYGGGPQKIWRSGDGGASFQEFGTQTFPNGPLHGAYGDGVQYLACWTVGLLALSTT
jgi:hypothetical protein